MNRVNAVTEKVQGESQIQKSSLAWSVSHPHMVWKEISADQSGDGRAHHAGTL